MAVSINNTVINTEDGNTVASGISSKSGSDVALIALSIHSENQAGAAKGTHSIASQDFGSDSFDVNGSSTRCASMLGVSVDADTWPASDGTYQADISTTDLNDASAIFNCAGVDQTTPFTGHESIVGSSTTSFPNFTSIDVDDGDLVVCLGSVSTANTISAPALLGGIDAWTEITDGANIIGGGAQTGAFYYSIATGDYPAEVITIGSSGSGIRFGAKCVIKAATGGAVQSIVPLVIQQFLSQQQ